MDDELYEGVIKYYSEDGKIIEEGEIKDWRRNGFFKKSDNEEEFVGEYLNNSKWNEKEKRQTLNYMVEG